MTGMVEKVARAICALHYQDPGELTNAYPDGPLYPVWKDFENSARAAIEALMEPDDLMKLAGGFKAEAMMFEGDEDGTGVIFNDMGHVYRAMIQAALKEGQE